MNFSYYRFAIAKSSINYWGILLSYCSIKNSFENYWYKSKVVVNTLIPIFFLIKIKYYKNFDISFWLSKYTDIFFIALSSITLSKLSSKCLKVNSNFSIFLLDFKKPIKFLLSTSLQFIMLRVILFQFSFYGNGNEAPEKSRTTSLNDGKFSETCK